MTYEKAINELESIDGVRDVRDGSVGSVKAVDFRIFKLERPTDSSNFVFGRFGHNYHGGLLRLPRVSKEYTVEEIQDRIESCIPNIFIDDIDYRFEPEVELDNDYHYPHVELNGNVRDSIEVTKKIANNYQPY